MAAPFKSENGHWQDESFAEKIEKVFDSGYLSDCVFTVGPEDETTEIIFGHKLMFILESPVMETMFTGNFVEAERKSEVRITDCQPKDFKNFRYMIYSNNIANLSKFSLNEIFEIYRICDKYLVSSIAKHCIDYMMNLLNNSPGLATLITLYGFACELEDKTLKILIESEIENHSSKVDMKLNDLSENAFYEYIKFISSKFCEEDESSMAIFNAIESYFKANMLVSNKDDVKSEEILKGDIKEHSENKSIVNQTLLSSLLELVDFCTMSPMEFIDGPGKSRLLDSGNKYEILADLVTNEQNY